MSQENWQDVAVRKQRSTFEKIPQEWRLPEQFTKNINQNSQDGVLGVPRSCGILSEKEIEITEVMDASKLLERIAVGGLSCYKVTVAFCKRAAIAHQLVNCLTEIFFDQALQRAKELDTYFEENGKPMGPLHGLPISLKDSFNVRGVHTTVAYVSFASNPSAEHNSSLVELLLQQGAIVYVKTNIPQTMMTADCDNPLFGRTLNPNKLCLTAGGSTGGEGALIKLRGSLVGAGTDVAGSLRIPGLCNGIYGFKPTSQRVPFFGKTPPGRLGSPSPIIASIGPEGHSVRDLELFMKTVIDADPWKFDDGSINVPWRKVQTLERPLRLGFILEDAQRPLHPPMLRTMKEMESKVRQKGHVIVPLNNLDIYSMTILAWKFFFLDPQKTPVKRVTASGEPWAKSVSTVLPPELQGPALSTDLDQLFDMNVERRKILKEWRDLVVTHNLDAILLPPYQATAQPHDTYGFPLYTTVANMLDWPAGVIPYLQANKSLDEPFVRPIKYDPSYEPNTVEGAPSGIQIMGPPMKDEELLKVMAVIDCALHEERSSQYGKTS